MRKLLYYTCLFLVLIACLNYASVVFGKDILYDLLKPVMNGNLLKGLYIIFAASAIYLSYDVVKNKEWFDLYLQATSV